MPQETVDVLQKQQQFLMNVVGDFTEEHADYKPTGEMMTVAQQVRHIARVTDWFREGAFGSGFNMDFESEAVEMMKPVTLEQAREELNRSFRELFERVGPLSHEEVSAPMAPNPILGECPKFVALNANGDHIAHHRGALTVYLRLLGMTPKMVYMD